MAMGSHKRRSGAELFAKWLLDWFAIREDAQEKVINCIIDLILQAQQHFIRKLNDDDLRKIFAKKGMQETDLLKLLAEKLYAQLKYCKYLQLEIIKGGHFTDNRIKDKVNDEIEALDVDEIKSVLVEVLKDLCTGFSEIIEEGHNMANIIDEFDFDKSCLPIDFDKAKYIDAVNESVGSIAKGEPEYIPAVTGLLIKDGHHDHTSARFHDQVQEAIRELNSLVRYPDETKDPKVDKVVEKAIEIFKKVHEALKNDASVQGKIFFQDFAAVCRDVINNLDRRYPGLTNFAKYLVKIYNEKSFSCSAAETAHGGGNGVVGVTLPPLSGGGSGSDEIVPDNIRAVATIYMSYQLEQLQLIPAADRVVELSMAGLLPYTYDNRMRIIDEYAWSQTDRLNDVARYSQYSRALGASGGHVTQDVIPNNEFSARLRHAVSSIANFAISYDTQKPLNDRSEYVRKSIRDFAANASYYGWAGTFFVAERLRKHINDAIAILSLPQIQDAYGVTNMWQVIERVAQREFGMTVNVVKHRTLALEGQNIFDLVADKAHIWSGATGKTLFKVDAKDSDLDQQETTRLFRSAQYILAVEGYGDTQVDQYSQPIATTATPSLPSLGAFAGAGAMPSVDASKIEQVRDMVSQGQMPNINQILKQ
jgi:hypothetical protein